MEISAILSPKNKKIKIKIKIEPINKVIFYFSYQIYKKNQLHTNQIVKIHICKKLIINILKMIILLLHKPIKKFCK